MISTLILKLILILTLILTLTLTFILTRLSRPAVRHLESLVSVSCLILFMAVMAWYHLCHLLLARMPLIQEVCRLCSTSTYTCRRHTADTADKCTKLLTLLSVIQGWDKHSPAVRRLWKCHSQSVHGGVVVPWGREQATWKWSPCHELRCVQS